MKPLKIIPSILISLFILVALAPKTTHAYVDPGTGSYVIQIILGTVLGGMFAIKMYSRKIKSFLGKFFTKKDDNKER